MRNTIWLVIVIILIAIIGVLGADLMKQPPTIVPLTPTAATIPTSTLQSVTTKNPDATSTAPLHERVSVAEPVAGAAVGERFAVSGKAPGPWYFEATFPIQVRDEQDNIVGRGHANAQGDWMTNDLVAFTAMINIEGGYKGPATLILLKDNPSGLPENDDSISIPIVIR